MDLGFVAGRILFGLFFRKSIKLLEKQVVFQKIKNITPEDIMKTRGNNKNGFRYNDYLNRHVDSALKEGIDSSNIVLIKGAYASGKSRMVYEYLKKGEHNFNYILQIEEGNCRIETIIKLIDSLSDSFIIKRWHIKKAILVLDDFHVFYRDYDNVQIEKLFNTIENKKIKTIITIPEGSEHFDDFVRCTEQYGINHLSKINIPIIKYGDEIYDWCVMSLKNDGYSPVIGGYVPEMERSFIVSAQNLTEESKKLIVTYSVSIKYRRNNGRLGSVLSALYKSMWNVNDNEVDRVITDSFSQLVGLGILKRTNIAEVKEGASYCYDVLDWKTYKKILSEAGRGTFSVNEDTRNRVLNYLINTPKAEINQIDAYLGIGKYIPEENINVILSRLILRSKFVDSLNYLKNKLDDQLNQNNDLNDFVEPIKHLIIKHPDGYDLAKEYIRRDESLANNMWIKEALLQRAYHHISERDYIRNEHGILNIENPTIYALRYIELLENDFDENRIVNVYTIYTNTSNYKEYCKYCSSLFYKICNENQLQKFRKVISKLTQNNNGFHLLLNSRNIIDIFHRHPREDEYLNLYRYIFSESGASVRFADFNCTRVLEDAENRKIIIPVTYSLIKEECKSFDVANNIYIYASEILNDTESTNRFLIELFKKGDDTNDTKKTYLLSRIQESKTTSPRIKLFNAYIEENCETIEKALELNKEIVKEYNIDALVDISTINVLLKIIERNVKKREIKDLGEKDLDDLKGEFFQISKLIKKHKLEKDDYFVTQFYTTLRAIFQKYKNQVSLKGSENGESLISKIEGIKDLFVFSENTDNEKVLTAKISATTNSQDAKTIITKAITDVNEYISIDVISNIMFMYSANLHNGNNESQITERRTDINSLILKYEERQFPVSITYYNQLLRYKLCNNAFENLTDLCSFIRESQKNLINLGNPIIENNNIDLYSIAIDSRNISIEDAYTLLRYADAESKGSNILIKDICDLIKRGKNRIIKKGNNYRDCLKGTLDSLDEKCENLNQLQFNVDENYNDLLSNVKTSLEETCSNLRNMYRIEPFQLDDAIFLITQLLIGERIIKYDLMRPFLLDKYINRLSKERDSRRKKTFSQRLQLIINRNLFMDYSKLNTDRITIDQPIALTYPNERHFVWDYYKKEDIIYKLTDSQLDLFYQKEINWVNKDLEKNTNIYLNDVILELERRGKKPNANSMGQHLCGEEVR